MGPVDVFASVVKMISSLAVVLGLMVAAAYVLKRVFQRVGTVQSDGGLVRVLSTHYLGPKNSVMVMEVLGNIMVIGISNNQMSLLATISDPEAVEKLREARKGGIPSVVTDQFMNYRAKLAALRLPGREKKNV
jgi:flagellar protein FliO/FliZ